MARASPPGIGPSGAAATGCCYRRLELTHLALVSYQLPDTSEIVPLLQIVPSKTDAERLLLVPPELASVLAQVITRLRDEEGNVPLVSRYDPYERRTGPPLPHLLQRRRGWRRETFSPHYINRLLNAVVERAGIRDAAGQPIRYTPHDFRRIFATEAVTGGLSVHMSEGFDFLVPPPVAPQARHE